MPTYVSKGTLAAPGGNPATFTGPSASTGEKVIFIGISFHSGDFSDPSGNFSATYDGHAMTKNYDSLVVSSFGLYLDALIFSVDIDGSTITSGAKTVVITNSGGTGICWIKGNFYRYTDVASLGTPQAITNQTSSTSASQTVTSVTGRVILQAFIGQVLSQSGAFFSSPNRTQRDYDTTADSFQYLPFMVQEAAGASSVAFTANAGDGAGGALNYAGFAIELIGASNIVLTPGGATVHGTGGTPAIIVGGPVVEQPPGTGISTAGGTPVVHTSTFNEFQPVIDVMQVGTANTQFLDWGDSTVAGYLDDNFNEGGWCTRHARNLGKFYDYNVELWGWDPTLHWVKSALPAIYTSPNPSRPILKLMQIGNVGTAITYDITTVIGGGMMTDAVSQSMVPLVTILGDGINDFGTVPSPTLDQPTLLSNFDTFISDFKAAWPSTKLIITTENPLANTPNVYDNTKTNDHYNCYFWGVLATHFGITANTATDLTYAPVFTPGAPIWQATNVTNVSMLDSRQFTVGLFISLGSTILGDGIHLNGFGYDIHANELTKITTNGLVAPVDLGPGLTAPTIHATPGTPSTIFGHVEDATGASTAATPGTPGVTAPYTVTPPGATVVATPGRPGVTAPYTATPPGASTALTPGTPQAEVGSTIFPPGATVAATPGTPGVTVSHNVTLSPAGAMGTISRGTPGVTAPYTVQPGNAVTHLTTGTPVIPNLDQIIDATGAVVHATPGTPAVLKTKLNAIWFLGVQGSYVGQRIITAAQWVHRLGAGSWQDTVWEVENGYAIPAAQLTSQQINAILQDVEFVFGQLGDRH